MSLESDGLGPVTQMHAMGREISGYLIEPGVRLKQENGDNKNHNVQTFVQAVVMAKLRLCANIVMLDPRLIQDKPEKMQKDVKFFLDHKSNLAGRALRSPINYFQPTHLTVDYYANRASMHAFIDSCDEYGVTPVCFTTSSRSTEQDYKDRDTTAEEFAKRSTDVISDIGFRAVFCAAADAQIVKDINPDLTIFASGGALDLTGELHPRPALIEGTREFVDYFVLGNSVYEKPDFIAAFDERLAVARGK